MAEVPIIALVFIVIVLASCALVYCYIRKHPRKSPAQRRREREGAQQEALATSAEAPAADPSRNHIRFPHFSSNPLLSLPSSSKRNGAQNDHPYRPQPATTRDHPRSPSPYALPNPTSLSNLSVHLLDVHDGDQEPMATVKNPSSSSLHSATGVRRSVSYSAVELAALPPVYLSTSPSNPHKHPLRNQKPVPSGVSPLPRPLRGANRPYITEHNTIQSTMVLNMTRPRLMDAEPPVVIVPRSPNMDPFASAVNTLRNPAAVPSSSSSSASPASTSSSPPTPLKNARRISANAKQQQQQQQQRVQVVSEAGPNTPNSNLGAKEEADVANERKSSENPFLGKEERLHSDKEEVRRPPQAILPEGFKQEPHSIPLPTLLHDHREPLNHQTIQTGEHEGISKDHRQGQSRVNPQLHPETVIEVPSLAPTEGNADDLYSEELVTTAHLVLEPYLKAQPAPPVPSPPPQSLPQVQPRPEPSKSVTKSPAVSPAVLPRRANSITPPNPNGPTQRPHGQEEPVRVPSPIPTNLPAMYSPPEPSTTWIEAFPLPRVAEPLPALPSQLKLPDMPHSLPPLQFSPLSSMSEIKTPSPTTLTAQPATSPSTTSSSSPTQPKTPPALPPPRGSRNDSLCSSNSSISTATMTSVSNNSHTQSNSSRSSSAQTTTSAPLTIQSRPITPLPHQPLDANSSPTAMSQASPTSAKVTSPKTPGLAAPTMPSPPWIASGSDGYHNDDREETRGAQKQPLPRNHPVNWDLAPNSSSGQGTTPDSSPRRKKAKDPQSADGAGARFSHFNFQ
ncbi:hypothetical protein EMPS_06720 [Entomortierella parvispora]|uniref:Uncharacterized protein n=1 Tax=Entomortierella parvispora TaxID=205924 RepID=A0A9P3LXR2_9FUNG|nr:hypothetical protein EMPS_06720 [Entomortierella parvispora]